MKLLVWAVKCKHAVSSFLEGEQFIFEFIVGAVKKSDTYDTKRNSGKQGFNENK